MTVFAARSKLHGARHRSAINREFYRFGAHGDAKYFSGVPIEVTGDRRNVSVGADLRDRTSTRRSESMPQVCRGSEGEYSSGECRFP